jgi:hypothetical protein
MGCPSYQKFIQSLDTQNAFAIIVLEGNPSHELVMGKIMSREELTEERWARWFLSIPKPIGATVQEGGACKKAIVDFSVKA